MATNKKNWLPRRIVAPTLFTGGLCLVIFAFGIVNAAAPTSVTSGSANDITRTAATLGGSATGTGDKPITSRGFEYGLTNTYGSTASENPDVIPEYSLQWGRNPVGDGHFQSPYDVAVDSSGNTYVADQTNHRIQKFDSSGNYVMRWGEYGYQNGDNHGQFVHPRGVAVDSGDNVYVVDSFNHRIQKFDSDGNFIAMWGSQGSGDSQFDTMMGIGIDDSDNVYVTDSYRIQKFDSNGNFLMEFGSQGTGDGQLNTPHDVAVDSFGNIYVSDTFNHRIQKFDSSGNFITKWGSLGSGDGQFNYTVGIEVDSSHDIVVVDYQNSRIQKFDSSGNFITKWGSGGSGDSQLNAPRGIAVDATDNIYIADTNNHRIQKFNDDGVYASQWGYNPNADGQFWNPYGTVTDSLGNVYVTDYGNNRIQKFDGAGNFITKWGSAGTGDSQFNHPYGIAIDASNNIYVADWDNHRIQKFDGAGNFITKWGSQGSADGQFSWPAGITVDASGNVYVADNVNYRIQKFDGAGNFITKWGSAGTGDGQFSGALGVATDSFNNVYVADTSNNRIQKFDSNGTFIKEFGSTGYGNGQFQAPKGIAIDASDNVYVTDYNNHRIEKFDSDGNFLTAWNTFSVPGGQFNNPVGITVDSSYNLYVADMGNNRIVKFTPDTNSGSFSSDLTGLTCGTTYHYRAYATNADGTSYGDDETFTTLACPAAPTVITDAPATIGKDLVNANLNITSNGNEPITEYGMEYGTSNSYGQTSSRYGDDNGIQQITISGLTCETTYHYRAYAINSEGTGYGDDETFTTDSCLIPAPTGLAATIVSSSQISLSWDPTAGAGNTYTLTYRKTGSINWSSINVGTDITTQAVTGLEPATQYDFRIEVTDSYNYSSLPSAIVTGTTAAINSNLISSCADLQDMDNDPEGHYELTRNIDCSDTINWNSGQGFDPIGTFDPFNNDTTPFQGVLNGHNYTISNLYCNRPTEAMCGLFSMTFNALIQDITLESPVMSNGILGNASLIALAGNTTIINVHANDATISGSSMITGGLIAGGGVFNDPNTDVITISKSSVTGTINLTGGATANIGGFIGGSESNLDVQNNYSNMAIIAESTSQSGGFIGYMEMRDSSIISNNYAAGSFTVTSADPDLNQPSALNEYIPTYLSMLGGFGGIYLDEENNNSTTATITNNFDHMALSSASPENFGGGFIVAPVSDGTLDLTSNYFDADQAGIADCVNPLAGVVTCGSISGQPNYFKNNATNPPLNSWNFSNIWKTTPSFPEFNEAVLTTPSGGVTPPSASGTQFCFTSLFGGACPAPSAPNVTPGVEQATGQAITAESRTTRGTKSAAPTDEQGVLGAIKHFVRSLPAVVVVAFPYALFILLGLAAVVLLIELVRELRRLHILQALIHKQRLLAEERDAFWHLAANYLRAPVTLIVGGAEALNDVKSTTTTKNLSSIAVSLQSKIAEIMKKIEGSTSLQAISQAASRPVVRTAKRAVFIIPVVSVGALAILGNYAAASFRGMSPGASGYLIQAALFVIVAVVFYWTLGLLSRGKSKRQAAESLLERQTNDLANARHELINDTAKQINPDLTKLEATFATLPAAQAALEPAKTLHEGANRLREIVSSFSMLIKVQEGTGMTNATAPKTLDLSTALNKVRSKLTPQIAAKGVRVVAPALPLAISAEADLANQVLESIIANAVDYSPANGTVKVEAQQLQDKIRLRITDQGKGIEKKQLDHLFQPFVRADGKSAMDMSHGGFGINLYLDKLIMEQMGGSISAASTPGKGTAITMEWPAA